MILFRYRGLDDSLEQHVYVSRNKASSVDGARKLHSILVDGKKNLDIDSLIIPKLVVARLKCMVLVLCRKVTLIFSGGKEVDISRYMKPNTHDHHGNILLTVTETSSDYIVHLAGNGISRPDVDNNNSVASLDRNLGLQERSSLSKYSWCRFFACDSQIVISSKRRQRIKEIDLNCTELYTPASKNDMLNAAVPCEVATDFNLNSVDSCDKEINPPSNHLECNVDSMVDYGECEQVVGATSNSIVFTSGDVLSGVRNCDLGNMNSGGICEVDMSIEAVGEYMGKPKSYNGWPTNPGCRGGPQNSVGRVPGSVYPGVGRGGVGHSLSGNPCNPGVVCVNSQNPAGCSPGNTWGGGPGNPGGGGGGHGNPGVEGGGPDNPWGGGGGPGNPGDGPGIPGGGGGVGPNPIFGPQGPVMLGPQPDNLKGGRGNDRHVAEINHIQLLLSNVSTWTHREVRHVMLNGSPVVPPQVPYANNPYWTTYLNRVLLPSTIRPELYKQYFGLSLQQFYQFRDMYVVPALANRNPYLATEDAVAVLFLLKLRKNIDYMSLQLFFGDLSNGTLECWFHCVEDQIYSRGSLLHKLRHLSVQLNKIDILEMLHGATLANSRCCAIFRPALENYMQQNPHLGHVKLVVIAWDSRHIPIPHTSSFHHQTRLYSTKNKGNALVKMVGTGMDGIGRYLFTLQASTSPSNTDQATARYLLETENNQGKRC